VCIDARMLYSSGIGRYLSNVIARLKNLELFLIIHPEFVKKDPSLLQHHLIPCTCPIYSISEQCRLPFLIPPCDLFWSPHFIAPLLPIQAKKRLMTIHDLYHFAFYSTLTPFQKSYVSQVIPRAIRRADRIITVSDFSYEEILKFTEIEKEKIKRIYPGVCIDQSSDLQAIDLFREKYRLKNKFILFVGNLRPHKNSHGLLRSFQLLKDLDLDLVLIAAKRGCDLKTDLERVFWYEGIPDEELKLFYQLAETTVVPSFYEGFGLPALEAMALSSPLVVSDRASLPEVCSDCALYADPDSPEEIANKIREIVTNSALRETLCNKGVERAKLFQWERCAQEHQEEIENLCSV
jgi:glycosyltransferase involved in cell wall biosynthesis